MKLELVPSRPATRLVAHLYTEKLGFALDVDANPSIGSASSS
jgi:hypothetical protein